MAQSKDLLRIGKISSFNYPKGTARITYEDKGQSTTAEMPFLSWQYWMPKVGDQVLVAHLSNGTCAAVILGPVWHDGHRPVEGFEGLYRREYSNQKGLANERYDSNEKAYTQTITGTIGIAATKEWSVNVGGNTLSIKNDGTITVTALKEITVKAPKLRIIGDIQIEGKQDITKAITTNEDVMAGEQKISLVNHTHDGISKPKS